MSTESDLRCYLAWCAERGLDPLAARRPHLELYIQWTQEIRRFRPSTVSRRFSVTAGFYRTCVIDGILEHSPAEHVRRPSVPAESPTLGFTHLQFEALLTAARESPNPYDFALVAMLGLLGLQIFEATGADISDLGEKHGHRVLRVRGKGTKVVPGPAAARSRQGYRTGCWNPHARAGPAQQPRYPDGPSRSYPPTEAPRRSSRHTDDQGTPSHAPPHTSLPVSTLASTCETSRLPPATPTRAPRCGTTEPATTSTATRTTSWPPTWPPVPEEARASRCFCPGKRPALPMRG